jgi:hypothetical protein
MNSHAARSWLAGLNLLCGAVLAVALSGCSSDEASYFRRMGEMTRILISRPVQAPQPQLTRAELNKIPYATIAVSSNGGPRAYLVPLADNGGFLDYRDEAGNSVRVRGGAVAGLQTAGNDLDGVLYDQNDPIAHPRSPALWPRHVWRQYQFSAINEDPHVISLSCVFQPTGPETIEIVEINYSVTAIREVCTNARRQVVNTYWVDDETGFIWKSEQWLGPRIGAVVVEVIRPYAG